MAVVVGAVALTVTACGGGSSSASTTTSTTADAPTQTFAGPAGLADAAQPQPNGYMWLLARPTGSANLQLLNLATGKITVVVPASADSVAIAQSPSGLLGVGIGTRTTGSLELRNGTSGVPVATVPIGAPVSAVFAGADGTTFYVLNGTSSSSSVTLVNSQTDKATVSVPVPLDTRSIVVDPTGQNLFAVGSGGTLDQISVGSGMVVASFPVGATPVALGISTSGQTLYVLKSTDGGVNVGVVDVQTESQTRALPAPANSVGVEPSIDGRSLYLVVGTNDIGNIQVFPLAA